MHIRIALSLAALALLPSCRAGAAPETTAASPVLLRTYDVPPGTATEVAAILNHAMYRDTSVGGAFAKVEPAPGGQSILVVGPVGIQEGVSGLLKSLASQPRLPPPATITMTYWLVTGKHAKDAPIPAELTELSAALKSIQQADGPMAFQTQEKLTLIGGSNDEWAEQESGRKTSVSQSAALRDGRVVARLKIRPSGTGVDRVETTIQLVPGQILVLAQAGTTAGDGSSLYYVVRADVAAAKP